MSTGSDHMGATSASAATHSQHVKDAIADIVRRSERAREQLTTIAPALDTKEDPKAGLQIAWQADIHRLSLPVEYGGLSDGSFTFALEPLMECLINICAGESSVGQMILTQALHIRMLLPNSGLSKDAMDRVARSFLAGDTRLVGSAAQPGVKEPVTATAVAGGVVINGVKQFNTQSEGPGWAEVACVLVREDGAKKPMAALIPLDATGVIKHHDWDNMGQRATGSQTITYENVFVPDGWHHELDLAALGPVLGVGMLYHAVLIQGIGEGAYDAMMGYVRELNRPSVSAFTSANEDMFMQRQIGVNRGNLWAAHVLLLDTARRAELSTPETNMMELAARAMAAKAASVRAALTVCDSMFDVCGARATANKYHLDRFWRNARTFACHDSTDAKDALVGAIELTGQMPMGLLPRI